MNASWMPASFGGAVNDSHRHPYRPGGPLAQSSNGAVLGVARRGLDARLQDDDAAALTAASNDQLQEDLTSTTTIATTSSGIFIATSPDMTQAFDNPQNPHWMIDSQTNRTTAETAAASSNNASASDLFAIATNQQQQLQQSFSDWWQEYWSRQPFPSGYTQSSITLVACLLTTIIFLIVVGNLLVCIAIFTEKSLKPTQNWFIASLAVSDMLLGLVVMPFSLARELMGFWIFGPLWCDIHEALDVLLSTASINTLCLISLDRYWSITQAVSYLKKRTPRRAVFMIAFVWVFSAAVSLPPLFGWKKQSPAVTAPAIASNSTRLQLQQQQLSQLQQSRPNETSGDDLAERRDGDEGSPPASSEQQEQQWQRKRRRRRRNRDNQSGFSQSHAAPSPPPLSSLIPSQDGPMLASSASIGRQQLARDNLADIPNSFQTRAAANFQQQQQPVITYAYLSSEPQPQLEQQQQQANEYPTCQLSDDVGYVLYSALGSFFIPCAVMVFTYIKIGLAARKRARRAINKQARAHQAGGAAKRGAGGGAQRRTIAGATSGRASKQLPVGDSALLLTPSLAPDAATSDSQFPGDADPDPLLASQRRLKGAHHHHRNSRAGLLETARQSTPTPPMMGKLVVVERQKTATATVAAVNQNEQQQPQDSKQLNKLVVGHRKMSECQQAAAKRSTSPEVISVEEQDSACCAATLITSGSKLASPSALQCSTSCGGISALTAPLKQQQLQPESGDQAADQRRLGHQDRKPTSESNDSSLITVMSASMNDLPQVTRFNFTSKQADQTGGVGINRASAATGSMDEEQRAAALLRAISCAGRELANEPILSEDSARDESRPSIPLESSDHDSEQANIASEMTKQQQQQQQQQGANNSTNETCFMTIEEDSDNLEAQTGRTIMMIASTAKQSSCSLAGKSQVGMMMTMLPAATQTASQQQNDATTIVCNNVACLRRRARRQANRHGSSYCGSSMTINDDDDEEDEDEEDEDDVVLLVGDEEDEDMMANGAESDDDCLEDDLLTDDCNGFSGSCRLDQYCTGTASSICAHCRECAALSGRAPTSGECPHDSPLSCTYNYNSKSTLQDSPQIHVCGSNQASRANAKRPRRLVCQHQDSASNQNSQDRVEGNASDPEGQSLTGDDNLSLTDYYRSNEDNSSIVGHDVLDATPAREHLGPKRRSIVASAIASVGGGINRMTSAGAGGQQLDQAGTGAIDGRKKSSIGFHLARFGSSGGGGALAGSNQAPGGGLLALAAASQQQQQLGTTRNLKTLRQNFFQKLNQLTAKSAAKQDNASKPSGKGRSPTGGKSSAHSSYGSSYEPSVDCATTSNMPSTNDQYHMETTFGETDDYEPQTSAETTKQSSDQISSGGAGGHQSPAGRLMSMAQQAAAASAATAATRTSKYSTSGHPVISSKDVQQSRMNPNKRSRTTNVNSADMNNCSSKRTQLMSTTDEGSNILAQSSSQISLTTEGERNVQSSNMGERQMKSQAPHDGDRRALISDATGGLDVKRRSNEKGASLALVCSSQVNGSDQRMTGTSATFRQGAGTSSNGGTVVSKAFLASDNERHKRKLAKARERRATLILGLIMATFICCWFPFFTFYVLRAICHVCRDYIPPRLEAFIFWMGYCNSAINPIIYTIFNRDFRKAFRKILFRCSRE